MRNITNMIYATAFGMVVIEREKKYAYINYQETRKRLDAKYLKKNFSWRREATEATPKYRK